MGFTLRCFQRLSLPDLATQLCTGAQPFSKATGGLPFGKASDSGNSATDWEIGDIAHHKKWGDGTVLEVTGSGKTQELKIKFPEVGLKKVLSSVAPIVKK